MSIRIFTVMMCLFGTGAGTASAVMWDFESDTDPFGTSVGLNWTFVSGSPTITQQVARSGENSLYNNFNATIGYNGPGIDYLWMRNWAGFPAIRVQLVGPNIIVNLTGTWQQVFLGGATNITFIPATSSTSINNFGTFAIDDINTIPEPTTAVGLLIGAAAMILRRPRK